MKIYGTHPQDYEAFCAGIAREAESIMRRRAMSGIVEDLAVTVSDVTGETQLVPVGDLLPMSTQAYVTLGCGRPYSAFSGMVRDGLRRAPIYAGMNPRVLNPR